MKYLPNQKPRGLRLTRKQFLILESALRAHRKTTSDVVGGGGHSTRLAIQALPTQAPYDLWLFPLEWQQVSKALRPFGSHPPPGSEAATYYALYTRLRKTMVFKTVGDMARLEAARKTHQSKTHAAPPRKPAIFRD